MTAGAIPHAHRARHITPPGGTLVCDECGTPLQLTCAKGHNPASYIIEADPQADAAREPAPKTNERRQSKTPPPSDGDL